MHGLRSDIDLSFLNGREVIQLAIGAFQTPFAFEYESYQISNPAAPLGSSFDRPTLGTIELAFSVAY